MRGDVSVGNRNGLQICEQPFVSVSNSILRMPVYAAERTPRGRFRQGGGSVSRSPATRLSEADVCPWSDPAKRSTRPKRQRGPADSFQMDQPDGSGSTTQPATP